MFQTDLPKLVPIVVYDVTQVARFCPGLHLTGKSHYKVTAILVDRAMLIKIEHHPVVLLTNLGGTDCHLE